jgi:hypothetical protein
MPDIESLKRISKQSRLSGKSTTIIRSVFECSLSQAVAESPGTEFSDAAIETRYGPLRTEIYMPRHIQRGSSLLCMGKA